MFSAEVEEEFRFESLHRDTDDLGQICIQPLLDHLNNWRVIKRMVALCRI